jgi:hypothetical protein
VDRSVAVRAAVLQAAFVAVVAVVLGAALDRGFFEDWGWLAGPGVWLACAAAVAALLRLPVAQALTGAALAGLPSVIFVLAGVHWAGAVLGVPLFALWCARLARDPDLPAEIV